MRISMIGINKIKRIIDTEFMSKILWCIDSMFLLQICIKIFVKIFLYTVSNRRSFRLLELCQCVFQQRHFRLNILGKVQNLAC